MKRPITGAALALLLLGLSAAGAADAKPRQLRSLDDFATQFNEDQGAPRVVLLLSPT